MLPSGTGCRRRPAPSSPPRPSARQRRLTGVRSDGSSTDDDASSGRQAELTTCAPDSSLMPLANAVAARDPEAENCQVSLRGGSSGAGGMGDEIEEEDDGQEQNQHNQQGCGQGQLGVGPDAIFR
jgi:hypothetical protein